MRTVTEPSQIASEHAGGAVAGAEAGQHEHGVAIAARCSLQQGPAGPQCQALEEGTRPTLRVKLFEEGTDLPVPGADVVIRLISTDGDPRELFSSKTDEDGFLEAVFEIPELPGAGPEAGGQAIVSDLCISLSPKVLPVLIP